MHLLHGLSQAHHLPTTPNDAAKLLRGWLQREACWTGDIYASWLTPDTALNFAHHGIVILALATYMTPPAQQHQMTGRGGYDQSHGFVFCP